MGVVIPLEESKRRSGASIESLVGLTRDGMDRVNEIILARAGSDVSMIPEVARHLIDSGGKRLRPMLTLAAARMCQYDGDGDVKLAASVEFMHTATLLHDDVVDESDLRRGKLAARKLWGNQASVLVGDFLLGQGRGARGVDLDRLVRLRGGWWPCRARLATCRAAPGAPRRRCARPREPGRRRRGRRW